MFWHQNIFTVLSLTTLTSACQVFVLCCESTEPALFPRPPPAISDNMPEPIFPNPDKLKYLSYQMGDEGGPCEHLLDYNGVRYHLLLDYNFEDTDCVENKCLQKCYDAFERDDEFLDDYVYDCLELFWPFVQKADAERASNRVSYNELKQVKTDTDNIVKIQVLTIEGCLKAIEHDWHFKYPRVEPVENNFPSLTLFSQSEVEHVAEIDAYIHKVIIRGNEHCLKTVYRCDEDSFIREIEQLTKIPQHPNIVKLIGVTDAGEGRIDGLVLGLISGIPLSKVTCVTTTQREKWKRQISETISFLHGRGFVWGDAKPSNILVDEKTDDAVLIDFGGGFTEGWVDQHLEGKTEGDMQGLQRIIKYIDDLTTNR